MLTFNQFLNLKAQTILRLLNLKYFVKNYIKIYLGLKIKFSYICIPNIWYRYKKFFKSRKILHKIANKNI